MTGEATTRKTVYDPLTELMAHYGTSHVIVTEAGGSRPVGVLSSLDVAAAIASPDEPPKHE